MFNFHLIVIVTHSRDYFRQPAVEQHGELSYDPSLRGEARGELLCEEVDAQEWNNKYAETYYDIYNFIIGY